MKTAKSPGFVYLWHDTKRNKFYLGSHMGDPDDGYVCSNQRMRNVYKARPETCKRRVLEMHENITSKELRNREQDWLQLIDDSELHGVRYYNCKKVAMGGDVVSSLPPERKELHRKRSMANLEKRKEVLAIWRDSLTPEERSERGRHARSFVKNHYRLSPAGRGENNHFYGKKHTDESRRKMSEKAKGRVGNRLGTSQNEETKRKIRLNNPHRKSIMTPDGLFTSAEEYQYAKGVSATSIRSVMKNCDRPISDRQAACSGLFDADQAGMTPRQIGYYYV